LDGRRIGWRAGRRRLGKEGGADFFFFLNCRNKVVRAGVEFHLVLCRFGLIFSTAMILYKLFLRSKKILISDGAMSSSGDVVICLSSL
jgi:hypothetical protein